MSHQRPLRVITASEDATGIGTAAKSVNLNGPPGELVGRITLKNNSEQHVVVRGLSLAETTRRTELAPRGTNIPFRARLAPGEENQFTINASISPTHPPGEITESIVIGGQTVQVRAVVQPNLEVTIQPEELYFVGVSAGLEHHAELQVLNEGNVPIQIPSLRHGTVLDLDSICRNLSKALRFQGDNGAVATLDAFFAGMKSDIAGAVELSVKEAGEIVYPGGVLSIHVTLRLPDDVNESLIYDGAFRMFEELIVYTIVPAAV